MNVYELYFSPTGGTKKAADLLTDALAPKAAQVNLTDSKTAFSDLALTAEDLAVIAVPSYAGRVPAVAVQRLAAVKGNGARAVLVCVYGNRAYEDTLVELADTAKEAGFLTVGVWDPSGEEHRTEMEALCDQYIERLDALELEKFFQ